MASKSHYQAKGIDFDAVRRPARSMTGLPEYAVSKLANVLFSEELARRVTERGIHTYVLHPGVVASEIWRNVPGPLRFVMTRFMKSPEDGSADQRLLRQLARRRRRHRALLHRLRREGAQLAATPELAAELWRRSEEWVDV